MDKLLSTAEFQQAAAELAMLGVHVAGPSGPGLPYALVGARSNPRWWLVPLQNSAVARSGLALFQPLLLTARTLKAAAVLLSMLGLHAVWAKWQVRVLGQPRLPVQFGPEEELSFAYFTGTASPHRKCCIQVMNRAGTIQGFVKFSARPVVARLLLHEAQMIRRVEELNLRTGDVPRVLFAGMHSGATVLITDTRKTAETRAPTTFTPLHAAFLRELGQRGERRACGIPDFCEKLAVRFAQVAARLPSRWQQRLDACLRFLGSQVGRTMDIGWIHGDFTPWNTFVRDGRLYVFDWEYGDTAAPLSYDVIHGLLNQATLRTKPPRALAEKLLMTLRRDWPELQHPRALLTIYILMQTLLQVERVPAGAAIERWDGDALAAGVLDFLLAHSEAG